MPHLWIAALSILVAVFVPVSAGAAAFGFAWIESRTPNHALERMTASPVIRRLDVLGSGHRSAWSFGGRSLSMRMPVLIFSLLFLLTGCSQAAKTATVDEMVAEIVKHATAGDTAFFAEYLDASYKGQEKQLIQQIKASGMADNYKSRLESSDTKAHLNYHYLEKGCHFQIDLVRQDGSWMIKRIWFCR